MEINKKKKDYRNHSKKPIEIFSNKIYKIPIEKNLLKHKTIETEEMNVETVNTSKILDRIEKEKAQIGFSLERLDNIDNSKMIGELDVGISSRIDISSENEHENTIENQEINNIENNIENESCDKFTLIKIALIIFLIGIVFIIIYFNIDK